MNLFKNHNSSNFQQLASAILELPKEQKLLLNDLLWSEDMPVQGEHQKIILDRIAKANDSNMIDWDTAQKMLK